MRDILEYEEDDFDEEYEDDGNDDIRREIMEAETNEVWLEEPADEDDNTEPAMNPLFGMFGFPGIPLNREEKEDDEDPEH